MNFFQGYSLPQEHLYGQNVSYTLETEQERLFSTKMQENILKQIFSETLTKTHDIVSKTVKAEIPRKVKIRRENKNSQGKWKFQVKVEIPSKVNIQSKSGNSK